MAYHSFHNYGLGIKTTNIETNMHLIACLIDMDGNFKEKVKQAITEHVGSDNWKWDTLSQEDFEDAVRDMDGSNGTSLAYVMSEVIFANTNIRLLCCIDYEGDEYLLFQPLYPWEMTDERLATTEESVEKLFKEWVSLLTDQGLEELEYEYQAAENGS